MPEPPDPGEEPTTEEQVDDWLGRLVTALGRVTALQDAKRQLFCCEDGDLLPADSAIPAGELMRLLDQLVEDARRSVPSHLTQDADGG